MTAYLWKPADNYPNTRIGVYNKKESIDEYEFFRGNCVHKINPKIIIDFECPKEYIEKYGSIYTTAGSPVVREDVLGLCNDLLKDQIQIFDVELRTKNGVLKNYKLVNILNLVEGIDLEHSICKYLTDEKTILGFKYLVLKGNCLGDLHIARLKETKSLILVSEALKERFEKNKVKGVRFPTPEEHYAEIYNLEKVFKNAGREWPPKKQG